MVIYYREDFHASELEIKIDEQVSFETSPYSRIYKKGSLDLDGNLFSVKLEKKPLPNSNSKFLRICSHVASFLSWSAYTI